MEKKKMSKAMVERLLIHSKQHKGGMRSKHNRTRKIESTARVTKLVPNKRRY